MSEASVRGFFSTAAGRASGRSRSLRAPATRRRLLNRSRARRRSSVGESRAPEDCAALTWVVSFRVASPTCRRACAACREGRRVVALCSTASSSWGAVVRRATRVAAAAAGPSSSTGRRPSPSHPGALSGLASARCEGGNAGLFSQAFLSTLQKGGSRRRENGAALMPVDGEGKLLSRSWLRRGVGGAASLDRVG